MTRRPDLRTPKTLRVAAAAALGVASLACAGLPGLGAPPVPPELVAEIAPALSSLGHPQADYQSATVNHWSTGEPSRNERYVDVEIRYLRRARSEPDTMVVRLYQTSEQPCRVSLDVLSDTGPEPILLDNALASDGVGTKICDRIAEMAAGPSPRPVP